MGHRDLWEQIDLLRGMGGEQLHVRWVPSELAGKGRGLHPNNLLPLSKRRRVTEWDALGLEPMAETSGLEAGPEVDSGGGSSSDTRSSSSSGSGESLSALSCSGSDGEEPYSTDVSDTRLAGPRELTVTSLVRMSVTVERGAEGRGGRVKRPDQ